MLHYSSEGMKDDISNIRTAKMVEGRPREQFLVVISFLGRNVVVSQKGNSLGNTFCL
jgi:hypothetical protein